MVDFKYREIDKKLSYEFIENMHYAKRKPVISFCFGLYEGDELVAILTIGKPASNFLCVSVCGEEYKDRVYELSRLCAKKKLPKNALSYFVSGVLRELKKKDLILVSYADTAANHHGYIYQATNWIYTGLTKERTDGYMPNNKHARHCTTEYKHLRRVRSAKHRYIYFCCNKKTRRIWEKAFRFDPMDYPKGDNVNYKLGERIKSKIINNITNEVFFE